MAREIDTLQLGKTGQDIIQGAGETRVIGTLSWQDNILTGGWRDEGDTLQLAGQDAS